MSLWPVGHREGLRQILMEFFCQAIGAGYDCLVSLWLIDQLYFTRLILLTSMEGVYLCGVFVPFGHREEVQYYFTGLFQPNI